MCFKYLIEYLFVLSFFLGFNFYTQYNKQVAYHSLPPYKVTIDLSSKIDESFYASNYWVTPKNTINRAILYEIDNTTAKFEIKTINRYSYTILQPFVYAYNFLNARYDHYLVLSHYYKKLISFHQASLFCVKDDNCGTATAHDGLVYT